MALHASIEAVKHANLALNDDLKKRTGVYVGTGMGGILSVEDGYQTLYLKDENRLKPYTVLMCMYNSAASAIATHFEVAGPNLTFSTACSSSAVAIGQAYKDIRLGAVFYTHLVIALGHHEKFNGTGYPNGLKGHEIPLEARIVAVADVFDALTSERPYKKAWTNEAALNYITEQSGQHFDPQCVTAFKSQFGKVAFIQKQFNDPIEQVPLGLKAVAG